MESCIFRPEKINQRGYWIPVSICLPKVSHYVPLWLVGINGKYNFRLDHGTGKDYKPHYYLRTRQDGEMQR